MRTAHDIKVWDPAVRIFHWTLAPAFLVAFVSGEDLLTLHVLAGYLVGVLVAFRWLWGLVGSPHARFGDFVYPLGTIRDYLIALWRGRPRHYLGHNPAGGAMVVALLVLLTLTTLSGLALYGYEEFSGPFAFVAAYPWLGGEWVEEAHEVCANLTLVLVGVHIAGVAVSSLLHGENLVRAMVTGTKRSAHYE